MMGEAYKYDLIVIGAGITGMVAAVTVKGLGNVLPSSRNQEFEAIALTQQAFPARH
jgi:succinate dehydrogenase/fumarate reductase flavoprotein subunit